MIVTLDELIKEIKKFPEIRWGLTGLHANPIHAGHIDLLREAYRKCGALIVAINSDQASIAKHGYSFMPFEHRAAILDSCKWVDYVIENPNSTMVDLLSKLDVDYYFKGGDVKEENINELEKTVCKDRGIEIVYNCGGEKTSSSSDFLNKYYWNRKNYEWSNQ